MIIQIALGIVLAWVIIVFVLPLLGLSMVVLFDKKEVILNFFYKSFIWVFAILLIVMIYSQGPIAESIVIYTLLIAFLIWFFEIDKYLINKSKVGTHKKIHQKIVKKEKTLEMKIWESKMLRIFYLLLTITFLVLGIGIFAEKIF